MKYIFLLLFVTLFVSQNAYSKRSYVFVKTNLLIDHEYVGGEEIEVKFRRKFFEHQLKYKEEAVLQGDYTNRRGYKLLSGSLLFKIELLNHIKNPQTNAVVADNIVYCATTAQRCFQDFDGDQKFDVAYTALFSTDKPISINQVDIEDPVTMTSPISYIKVSDEDKKVIGSIWFNTLGTSRGSKKVNASFSGIEGGSSKISDFIVNISENPTIEFFGSKITFLSMQGKKYKFRLDKPIPRDEIFYVD